MEISAVVVSFNSEKFLEANFRSLFGQTVPFQQVIVVDNASQDGARVVMDAFPALEKVLLPDNIGYAAAANQGIERTTSALVLVANADIFLDPEFNRRVLEFFARQPQAGLLSPLILRFDRETIDSAGQECSLALYPRESGYGRPLARATLVEREVFSVCGAATVFSRRALDILKIAGEYYDSDFFMFWEDFDIGWRARILGLKVFFTPGAVAYHFRSATLPRSRWSRFSLTQARPAPLRFHLLKNRYLTLIKNYRFRRLWWTLPFVLAKDLLWAGSLTIRSPKIIIALVRSRSAFKRAWEKRKLIKDHE
ncbi:MAG: glycosyltransferase family 2 protein [Acidobacteriota bacterium]|nr:glycosyltransferase family 2 protein [Acidobacteriota bacterium]